MKHHNKRHTIIYLISALFILLMPTGCNSAEVITKTPQPSAAPSATAEAPKKSQWVMETPAPTPAATAYPAATPAPGVSQPRAMTLGHGFHVFHSDFLSDEEAFEIMQKEAKKEGEKVTIPVYSEDVLLYGKWVDAKGRYYCIFPGLDNGSPHFYNSEINHLNSILSVFPNGALRDMGGGKKYLMYDTETGSRIYVFFNNTENSLKANGYSMISSKKLSYADMKALKTGQTMDDVMVIDPSAKYVEYLYSFRSDKAIKYDITPLNLPINTVHLLTDGVMKLTYERSGEEGSYVYTITDIEYHDDFKMKSVFEYPRINSEGEIRTIETDYRIAKEDYVD